MKTIIASILFLAIPIIAWLPARLWTVCGDPWCLKIYPEWLDNKIYSLASPYLANELSIAAEQMEFLEVWIVSVLILQLFTSCALFLCRNVFKEDE